MVAEPGNNEAEEDHKKNKLLKKKKNKKRKHREQEERVEATEEIGNKKKKKKHKHKHDAAAAAATTTSAPLSSSPPQGEQEDTPTLPALSGNTKLVGFTSAAKARFPELTAGQWKKLEELGALVHDWNGKVNVISRKDIENVIPHHVLPCVGVCKLLFHAPAGTKVMDVGTGGGFPGLPLAICCPHIQFLLVDSIGKKIKVVGDMAKKLGLTNVTARHTRVEEVREKFNFVTGRSVTAMPRFVGWVQDKFVLPPSSTMTTTGRPTGGILYIKGGINEENQVEDLGGWVPTARYPISELIGGAVYDGDKSVLYFSIDSLQRAVKHKK